MPDQTESIDSTMSRNQSLLNKFAVGDEVWAVVSLGANLKVNKYPIKGMNAEHLGDKWKYMYHLPIGNDGHADGINMTVVDESLMFFDRESAEKRAHEVIGDIKKEYDKKIESDTKEYEKQMEDSKNKFERMIAQLMEEKEKCNADDLVVQPREVSPDNSDEYKVAEKLCSHGELLENCKEEGNAVKPVQEPTPEGEGGGQLAEPDCLICGMKTDKCVCANPTTNEETTSETTNEESESSESEGTDGDPSEDSEQPAQL